MAMRPMRRCLMWLPALAQTVTEKKLSVVQARAKI